MRIVGTAPTPLQWTSTGCKDRWMEPGELAELCVGPERTEGGFFEGFATTSERDGGVPAGESRVPGDHPQDLVDLEDSVRHRRVQSVAVNLESLTPPDPASDDRRFCPRLPSLL